MTHEEFLKLNNIYRMVTDWDDELKYTDKDSAFIPCYKNRGMCYWVDENTLGIIMFCSPHVPITELEGKYNIKVDVFGEKGEYSILFDPKDIEKIGEVFEFKKQALNRIPPHSVRNITTFLRVMTNVHPRYKDILDEYIDSNRIIPKIQPDVE